MQDLICTRGRKRALQIGREARREIGIGLATTVRLLSIHTTDTRRTLYKTGSSWICGYSGRLIDEFGTRSGHERASR